MKLAVVGTGVSGLVSAWLLKDRHDLTVFEADTRIGGHTHTVDCPLGQGTVPVDTGFIVYNERNYPGFTTLLDRLGVATQPAPMSFSLRCERTGLEYGGSSLAALFARWRNLLSPGFWRLLSDLLRFGREAGTVLGDAAEDRSLGQYLAQCGYSPDFVENYLVPMGAAIWSAPPGRLRQFPVRSFVRFFHNHGMLDPRKAPQWRTVTGGSKRYVERITEGFRARIRTGTPVRRIERDTRGVELLLDAGERLRFDQVILACHSDQALALLAAPTAAEREILGAIPYQENEAVLHTDARVLPRRRGAWSGWNYHRLPSDGDRVAVTYNLSLLQGLPGDDPFLVTLNRGAAIQPGRVLARLVYHHPAFSPAAFRAQARKREISGQDRTWYAGAYWGYGFHEDGVQSALDVGAAFGARL